MDNLFKEIFETAFAHMNKIQEEMDMHFEKFPFGTFNETDNLDELPEQPISTEVPDSINPNLRNYFLKPEQKIVISPNCRFPNFEDAFKQPMFSRSQSEDFDENLDGKITFENEPKHSLFDSHSFLPYRYFNNPLFENRSVIISRIQRPDGTFEEKKTLKNSDGTEETKIINKKGDRVHTYIERKNAYGTVTTQENTELVLLEDNRSQNNNNEQTENQISRNDSQRFSNESIRDTKVFSILDKVLAWLK